MRLHKVKLALITVLCLLNCTAVLFRLVVNMPVRLIEELRFFFQCTYSSSLMSESSASTSPSITDFFPLQQETTRPMRKALKKKSFNPFFKNHNKITPLEQVEQY